MRGQVTRAGAAVVVPGGGGRGGGGFLLGSAIGGLERASRCLVPRMHNARQKGPLELSDSTETPLPHQECTLLGAISEAKRPPGRGRGFRWLSSC